jgi:hypothetical protein
MPTMKISNKNGCIDDKAKLFPGKQIEAKHNTQEVAILPSTETSQENTQIDWTALCEFEPAQKSVLPLLNVKRESAGAVAKFDAIQSKIEQRITSQMEELIHKVQEIMDSLEAHYTEFEGDIESIMMNNHRRRLQNQKRVEKSAKKAQSLFMGLLNGLCQTST